jgi:SAM-dependent methyltransferase
MNADEYTKMYELEDHYWWFVGRRRLALGLLDRYGRGGELLDVGCGTGVVSRELQARGRVTSLDFASLALEYAARRSLPRLVKGDAVELPFRDDSFDAIVGLDIFEHLENDDRAFAEAFRVLRPGGVLLLSVPAFRSLWGPHDVALHHFRRYRRGEMRRKLRAAGFGVRRCSYSVFFLFPVVVITRMGEKLRRGPARASLPAVPGWMNRALIRLQEIEARLLLRFDLPWGSSVVAVARKPDLVAVTPVPAEMEEVA